jgi:hypothetical protein
MGWFAEIKLAQFRLAAWRQYRRHDRAVGMMPEKIGVVVLSNMDHTVLPEILRRY